MNYHGEVCELASSTPCEGVVCKNGGVCKVIEKKEKEKEKEEKEEKNSLLRSFAKCVCSDGYTGL